MIDVHSEARRRLLADGKRYTSGCKRLIDLLTVADRPVSIPTLLAGDAELVQSSVYRNLANLAEAGVVERVVVGDDFTYFELTEDLTGHHHHHLICESCGGVTDFEAPPGLEAAIAQASATVADDAGFVLTDHRVDLVGVCGDCR